MAILREFLLIDQEVLGTRADDAVSHCAMFVEPLHLWEDGSDAHAAADEHKRAFAKLFSGHVGELGWLAQRTYHIVEAVAHLVLSHLLGGFTDGLEDDGHRPFDTLVITDCQRNTFRILFHLDDKELTRQCRVGNSRGVHIHQVGFRRESFLLYNFEHGAMV